MIDSDGWAGLTFGEEADAERELAAEDLDLALLLLEAPDAGVDGGRLLGGEPAGGPRDEELEVEAQVQGHPDLPDVQPHARKQADYHPPTD